MPIKSPSGQPIFRCEGIAGVPGTAVPLTPVAASSRTAAGLTADVEYEFACTEDCYIVFGNAACTADSNDTLIPAGIPRVYTTPSSDTYVACIRDTVNGKLRMTPIT